MAQGFDNSAIIDAAAVKIRSMVNSRITKILYNYAQGCISDAIQQKGYQGFTGNTQTSYTAGIYHNGKLVDVVHNGYTKKPVARKVRKDQLKYLENPYEGEARVVEGKVDVNNISGEETAIAFLKAYKDAPKIGWAVVVTTGTEYSQYLEKSAALNVLTNTAAFSDIIFNDSIGGSK